MKRKKRNKKVKNLTVSIDKIKSAGQVRTYFDDEKITELTESIKQYGIIEPLVVKKQGQDEYKLICGARRLRAAKEAGLQEVPIVIKKTNKEEIEYIQITENTQREDLNLLELNRFYEKLSNQGLSVREIAQKVGKSIGYISGVLSISKLPDKAKTYNNWTLRKLIELGKIKDENLKNKIIDNIDKETEKTIKNKRIESENININDKIKKFNDSQEDIHLILETDTEIKVAFKNKETAKMFLLTLIK